MQASEIHLWINISSYIFFISKVGQPIFHSGNLALPGTFHMLLGNINFYLNVITHFTQFCEPEFDEKMDLHSHSGGKMNLDIGGTIQGFRLAYYRLDPRTTLQHQPSCCQYPAPPAAASPLLIILAGREMIPHFTQPERGISSSSSKTAISLHNGNIFWKFYLDNAFSYSKIYTHQLNCNAKSSKILLK